MASPLKTISQLHGTPICKSIEQSPNQLSSGYLDGNPTWHRKTHSFANDLPINKYAVPLFHCFERLPQGISDWNCYPLWTVTIVDRNDHTFCLALVIRGYVKCSDTRLIQGAKFHSSPAMCLCSWHPPVHPIAGGMFPRSWNTVRGKGRELIQLSSCLNHQAVLGWKTYPTVRELRAPQHECHSIEVWPAGS